MSEPTTAAPPDHPVVLRGMPTVPQFPPPYPPTDVQLELDLPGRAREIYARGVLGPTDKRLLGSCRRVISTVAEQHAVSPVTRLTLGPQLHAAWKIENDTHRGTVDDTGMRTARVTVRGWALHYLADYLPLGASMLGHELAAAAEAVRQEDSGALPGFSPNDPWVSWRLDDGRCLFDQLHVTPHPDCVLDGWMRRRAQVQLHLGQQLFGQAFIGVRILQLRPPFVGAWLTSLDPEPTLLPLSSQWFDQGIWS